MARWFVDRCAQRGIPSVSLRQLLPGARFVGCRDLVVSGCAGDSRRVEPGQVFVALKDDRGDGHDGVRRAVERGAVGVVVERPCPEAGPLQIVVGDSRAAFARLCHALAGSPSEGVELVGLAGTRGKTAAALFLRAIVEAAGRRCGYVGPSTWSDGLRPFDSIPATPGAEGLAEMLAAMTEAGARSAVAVLGLDALARRVADGLVLDAVVVTHLGDSGDAESLRHRRRLTARLARSVRAGGLTVVNGDDPEADPIGAVALETRRVAFGLDPAHRPDVTAAIDRLDRRGAAIRLRGFDREAAVDLGLIGRDAVTSALAAAAVALAREIPLDAVVAGLESVRSVPGRLESLSQGEDAGLGVFVDRARTAPELARALAAVREAVGPNARIHCVFGAEGRTGLVERLALARAAERTADRLILTSDNPKDEDPDAILDDLRAGLKRPGGARTEADRRAAIAGAIGMAASGDAVLIAGKGRDAFQIVADRATPFDDRAVAAEALALRAQGETARRLSA